MGSTETPKDAQPTRPIAKLARGASGFLLLAFVLVVVATMLVPFALGYHQYAIRGGSMEPTIHRGSIAYTEEVPVSALRSGDVITYIPPGHSQPVTHRIVSVTRPQRGLPPVFRTKGDANAGPDLRPFRLDRPTEARFVFSIPLLGWVLIALEIPLLKIVALAIPAAVVGLMIVVSLWRDSGRLLEERRGEDEADEEYWSDVDGDEPWTTEKGLDDWDLDEDRERREAAAMEVS